MNADSTIYMDCHASTPVDPRVVSAMSRYADALYANPHASEHALGWQAHEAVDHAAAQLAQVIGAAPEELIFTSGATEANNLAIFGLAARAGRGRRRILLSTVEHDSVLAVAHAAARRHGLEVELIPVDREGTIRLDVLESRLADDVLLVSLMLVNNEIGTIEPVSEVARLCRRHGALLHSDGTQALAAADIDVCELDVDLLSLSAHKIYGPKGVGALFARLDVQESIEPLIVGGGQQRGLRAGTLPVSLCVGLATAASLMKGPAATDERVRISKLRDLFLKSAIDTNVELHLNGPALERRHPGNANICFRGRDAHRLIGALQPQLACSTGSACTSGVTAPSHVLQAIGLSVEDADASIRFGLGRFTTVEHVRRACDLLTNALSGADKA